MNGEKNDVPNPEPTESRSDVDGNTNNSSWYTTNVRASTSNSNSGQHFGRAPSSLRSSSESASPYAYGYTEDVLEDFARQQERGVRGYGYEGDIDTDDTTTKWGVFVDEYLPYCGRVILLTLSCPLMLAALIASQFSVLAFSEAYHSHPAESCKLRVASFWCVFAPVAIQFLLIFSRWLCSSRKKDPDHDPDPGRQSARSLRNKKRKKSRRYGNLSRLSGASPRRAAPGSETKSMSSIGRDSSSRTTTVTNILPSTSESKQDQQGRQKNQSSNWKIVGIQVFIDALLSAVGNLVLMFSVIPFQNWAWTAVYIMLIPFLPNSFEFIHRLCFSPSNKHHRHGMQKLRVACDGFVFLSHCALFAIVVYRSFNDSDLTDRGLLVPFTLFGGISVLRTRLSDDRSPLNGFNIYGTENAQRLKLASIKLFMEAFILASIGTFVLPLEGSSSWWKSCSTSNLRLLWDYNSMLENRYMILACIHVASSIFAIILARLVSSVRMNLMGLTVPLALFWVSFFTVGILFPDKFPSPSRWGSNLGTQDHAAFIPIICVACIAQSLTTRRIWYELDTSLPLEESVWYTPFFNSLTLEQSLLLNRGDKRSSRKRRHTELNVPINNGAGHEDDQLSIDQLSIASGRSTPGGSSAFTESLTSEDGEAERMVLKLLDRLDSPPTLTANRKEHHIAMATCMWHETEDEMTQWVQSLRRVLDGVVETAERYFISPTGVFSRDTYEAHIVMDSALERPSDFSEEDSSDRVERRRLNKYAETLLDIISRLIVDIEHEEAGNPGGCDESSVIRGRRKLLEKQTITEYGVLLKVDLISSMTKESIKDRTVRQSSLYDELTDGHKRILNNYFDVQFTLHIHLKDPMLAKPGKRMNQVLYMNFVIGSIRKYWDNVGANCSFKHPPDLTNTLLLTTDGDTSFDFKDVDVLVDSMVRQRELAGACGRIRPLGSGPMIWYQKFEYASGHWFQKAAEHVMGTVQCSPGCFSIFRLSRLNDILATYSSPSEGPMEYLRKDQGEDRWMCTLLIQRGWKLSYCAAAVAYTYAPEDFDTFLEQRRRWLSSTIANMYDLILTGSKVSNTYGDSGLPLFYRIYIALMFALGLLTPGTIVLLVAGGVELALTSSTAAGFFISILLPLTYVFLVAFQDYRKAYGTPKLRCGRSAELGQPFNESLAVSLIQNERSPEQNLAPVFKRQQLIWARILSAIYVFLLLFVFAGLMRNAVKHFLEADNIFFLALVGLFVGTIALHPRDIMNAHYGIVYFIGIPAGYLVLYMYAVGNMNVMSWGTRSVGSEENKKTLYNILDDPVATAVSIRQRNILALGSQYNEVLAHSLSQYFGVEFVLDGSPYGGLDSESFCEYRTQELAQAGGKSFTKLCAHEENLCAVVFSDQLLLTSIANFVEKMRRGDWNRENAHMEKVILFSDEYEPVLKEMSSLRRVELDSLGKWGGYIRENVLKRNILEQICGSLEDAVTQTGDSEAVETDEQRKARIKEELDTLRNQSAFGMLIVNLFMIIFIAAMSRSSDLRVFHSNTAGLAFLGVCAIVLITQFVCMILHRWETLLVLVSFPFHFERKFHRFIVERFRENKIARTRGSFVGAQEEREQTFPDSPTVSGLDRSIYSVPETISTLHEVGV